MKNSRTHKKKISTGLIISFALHAVALIVVAFMLNSIHVLNKEADFLSKQALQFNGRTNNLEGCWKNNDYECPENKYFDASQFVQDEK